MCNCAQKKRTTLRWKLVIEGQEPQLFYTRDEADRAYVANGRQGRISRV